MMAGELKASKIATLPDVGFDDAWYGDFIEVAPGLYKEILCVSWHSKEKRWSVTTVDKTKYHNPETFRYKKNPAKPEEPAFM